MRRRVDESQTAGDLTEGVLWWDRYPSLETATDDEIDAWSAAYHAWCDERGIDSHAVTVEAMRLGKTDRPWNPAWG